MLGKHIFPLDTFEMLLELYCFSTKNKDITFRNGMGSPTSTHRYVMLSANSISVSFSNIPLICFNPSCVSKSQFSVSSIFLIAPFILSVSICTLSRFRTLTIVAVFSRSHVFKILFSRIKFISVVFPELVSPKKKKLSRLCKHRLQFCYTDWLIFITV